MGLNLHLSSLIRSMVPRGKPRTDAYLLAGALAAVLLLPLLTLDLFTFSSSMGDEGFLLNGARRILHGQVIYRDFFAFQTPGPYYALAWAYSLMGESLFAARLLAWLTHAGIIASFLGIAHRVGLGLRAQAFGLVALLAYGPPFWYIFSHHWLADACLLLSLFLLLRPVDKGPTILLGAGAAAGLCVLMLQDQGVYWILAAACALAFANPSGRWRRAGLFLAGVLGAGFPVGVVLLWKVPFGSLWSQLVAFPLTGYHSLTTNKVSYGAGFLRGLGYLQEHWAAPAPAWAKAFLLAYDASKVVGDALVACAAPLAAVLLAFLLWRHRRDPGARWHLALLAAAWLALILTALHRPALLNLVWAFPGSLLVGLWAAEREWPAGRVWARTVAGWTLAAIFLVFGFGNTVWTRLILKGEHFALPGGQVVSLVPEDQKALALGLQFRKEWLSEGQRVYCYSYNGAWYELLHLDNPTRYDIWDWRMFGRERTEAHIAGLEAAPPDWILLDRYSQPDDPVAKWIAANYQERGRAGALVIARRKGT